MAKTTLNITGMHCASCKALIEEVSLEVSGVKACIVDPEKGTAVIEHDETFQFQPLKQAIEALGEYKVEAV